MIECLYIYVRLTYVVRPIDDDYNENDDKDLTTLKQVNQQET